LPNILNNIIDVDTYKSVNLTSKLFYLTMNKSNIKYILCNPLWYLISKYCIKPWGWDSISRNPNITMEMIKNNSDKPWDWDSISMNPNLTMEMIENNPDKHWDWDYISMNSNLTMEMIENNPDKPWNWKYISGNTFNNILNV
jgi:hypothetical protein